MGTKSKKRAGLAPLRLKKLRQDYERHQYFTMVEAADFMGISVWVLRDMARSGRIPRIKIGARVLFDRSDLDRFMISQKQMQNLGPYRQPQEKRAP